MIQDTQPQNDRLVRGLLAIATFALLIGAVIWVSSSDISIGRRIAAWIVLILGWLGAMIMQYEDK
jgi:hypothetical protein